MDSAIFSALIAGAVAIGLSWLTNRQKTKAAEGKKAAEVIAAETARRKVLAELDDIAMDRAARINETVIDGLNYRLDLSLAQEDWSAQVIELMRSALIQAGVPVPPLPPRPLRPQNHH